VNEALQSLRISTEHDATRDQDMAKAFGQMLGAVVLDDDATERMLNRLRVPFAWIDFLSEDERKVAEVAPDDVAAVAGGRVERGRPATAGASSLPMALLVGGLGDARDDPAAAQVAPDRTGGAGVVATDRVGAGPWATGLPTDAQVCHQGFEHRGVASLTGGQQHDQGHPAPPTIIAFGGVHPPRWVKTETVVSRRIRVRSSLTSRTGRR
jgi:hypothetical protein